MIEVFEEDPLLIEVLDEVFWVEAVLVALTLVVVVDLLPIEMVFTITLVSS